MPETYRPDPAMAARVLRILVNQITDQLGDVYVNATVTWSEGNSLRSLTYATIDPDTVDEDDDDA